MYERNEAERILVVENNPDNLASLVDRLWVEFPEARIDTATNLADALELVRAASDRGEFYHVACLDVRLPRDATDPEEQLYPEERKQLLRALRERTVIVNYTGHYSQQVREAVTQLDEPNFPKTVLVDASFGREWTKELLHYVRQAIYGRRINRQLDRMLEASQAAPLGGAALRTWGTGGTQSLGALIRDIRESWEDLDVELKRRIENVFDVRQVGDELIVNP